MKNTYILIYGRGGHQMQMERLLANNLILDTDNIHLIAITDSANPIIESIKHSYIFNEYRDKSSYCVTFRKLPFNTIKLLFTTFSILKNYRVKGVITTGPGIALIPTIIFW
jgi:UDP-N-acetylglucosamine:LPS N-acetylglucosamine transferase